MHVLIFEHVSGGGEAGQPLGEALLAQGQAMRQALTADFRAAGCTVTTTCDARLQASAEPNLHLTWIGPTDDPAAVVQAQLQQVDAALMVAPETGGLLQQWTKRVEQSGALNLGSHGDAVAQCSDKLELAERFMEDGVPTPTTQAVPESLEAPMIAKPADGAGCEDTFFIESEAHLARLPARDQLLYQPWVAGEAVSASLIVHASGMTPLCAARQRIAFHNGRLHYEGGALPLPQAEHGRAMALAVQAARSVPGLRGFVGVDLVLGQTPEADRVIEINPRPTVSYIGLCALSAKPIASLLMDHNAPPSWHPRQIAFNARGQVTETTEDETA
jgi:predicted ATP-grasp superfamily ATP-dependent carboligase